MSDNIKNRKQEHIDVCLKNDIYSALNSGFEKYKFEHVALPEIDFADIDTSIKFLEKPLNMPLMISSMTGGNEYSEKINRILSQVAHDYKIGFAVGSQRIAIDDSCYEKSFQVRKYAPDILLFANLGAVQLNYGYGLSECQRAVDMIEADALIFHLNPIHELFQVGGNVDFHNLLIKIEKICNTLSVPVIVKEIGYGISSKIAKLLQNAGVYAVDVAGSGSISWVEVEKKSSTDVVLNSAASAFSDWGIPTVDCLKDLSENTKHISIISSGGVKTGVDIAKSIALGAKICGNASEFLKRATISMTECERFIESMLLELKIAMFCSGCKCIKDLKKIKLKEIK